MSNSLGFDKTAQNTICIQIGNSATETNNHFEIIDFLKKFQSENIKIFAPLAYGESVYADKVINYGKEVFNDKFIGITEFMDFKKFVLFMSRMDIIIFNNERQQAMGNLWLAMYLKKKIFIREESTLWGYFENDYNIIINKTKTLKDIAFSDLTYRNETQLESNKVKVNQLLSEKHFVGLWSEVFNK